MKYGSDLITMSKKEKALGWVYLPIHIFILPILLPFAVIYLYRQGIDVSDAQFNLVYYLCGFLFLGIALMGYLRENFRRFCDNISDSLRNIMVGIIFYYTATYCVNFILGFFVTDLVNPNTDAVIDTVKENARPMFAVAVLLAPIVEETLFRGVIFGNIRTKNRILAYVISAVVFSFYHLWQYLLIDYEWKLLLLYTLQYLPASIMLAKCYEDSGNLWSPIFMHMTINFVAILVSQYA